MVALPSILRSPYAAIRKVKPLATVSDKALELEGYGMIPPLAEGKYSYEVRATWSDNGKEVTRAQTIQVAPGRNVTVDFTANQDQKGPRE